MKTVCIDGPLYGKVIAFDGPIFTHYIREPFAFSEFNELPTPSFYGKTLEYRLAHIPYAKISPYCDDGGEPDLDKLSIEDWSKMRLIMNKGRIDPIRRSFIVWSGK